MTDKAQVSPDVVAFDGPDDPENPQNWTFRVKAWQTGILAVACIVVMYASSVFAPATVGVSERFGVSTEVGILGTTLYLLGYVVGPPIWGPASERFGRRRPLLASFFLFSLFNIMPSAGENLATVLIGRFLVGIAGSGPLGIVAGSYADMWSKEARGLALAIFAVILTCGPALGPFLGAFIANSYLTWRWNSWLVLIWGFATFAVLLVFMRESYAPTILQNKAKELRYSTKNWIIHAPLDESRFDLHQAFFVYFSRPLLMLVREPIVLVTCLYIAFAYALVYGLFFMVPYIFVTQRGWDPSTSGLPFLALLLGSILAVLIFGVFQKRYKRTLIERRALAAPDERCLPMAVGGVMLPLALFLFAWTAPIYVDLAWPEIIAMLFVGTAFVLIFLSGINVLVDSYLLVANSAMAASGLTRAALGSVFPLFAIQMVDNLGVQWAVSTLAFIALALVPFPFICRRMMPRLLAKSKYAPKLPARPPAPAPAPKSEPGQPSPDVSYMSRDVKETV